MALWSSLYFTESERYDACQEDTDNFLVGEKMFICIIVHGMCRMKAALDIEETKPGREARWGKRNTNIRRIASGSGHLVGGGREFTIGPRYMSCSMRPYCLLRQVSDQRRTSHTCELLYLL